MESKVEQIRNILINVFEDGNTHKTGELLKIIIENGFTIKDRCTLNVALLSLIQQGKICRTKKGLYIKYTPKYIFENVQELEKNISYVSKTVDSLHELDWRNCTDEEMKSSNTSTR